MVRDSCLFYEKEFIEAMSKDKMCLTKNCEAHVSFVNQIEGNLSYHFIFTTGISDQQILKWEIIGELPEWDLDHKEYIIVQNDLFGDVEPKEKFTTVMQELLESRSYISDAKQNTDETKDPDCELILTNIIGRRSYTGR